MMAPLEQLLVSGSDTRLILDPKTQLNIYGCAPHPRDAVISFASTTASSISWRAHAAAQGARARFIEASLRGNEQQVFDQTLADLRARLKRAFALDDPEVEIVLAPSGTDAQLLALFIARATLGAPLTSIVVAAEETGSGTSHTALGQHFNSQAANGSPVVKGAAIEGLADGVARVDITVRNRDGSARSLDEIDSNVMTAIGIAHAHGRKIVLFAMDQSKSGLGGPSNDCLRYIRQHWSDNVQIVIDACQGRISPREINEHLADGRLVLMTGSKFFAGPPFSGAVFVPSVLADKLEHVHEVPAGLCDYSGSSEWPERWAGIRAQLPGTMNRGLWLRWEAALAEIEAYHSVPEAFRTLALNRFADAMPSLFAQFPSCRLVDLGVRGVEIRTIYPFLMANKTDILPYDKTREVYAALNRDLSAELPGDVSNKDRQIASTLCHIGQPFLTRDQRGRETGALRISADARLVSEAWKAGSERAAIEYVDSGIDEIRAVFEKIEFILKHNKSKDLG
ncbi:MAG: hypothetical protein WAW96_09240 [Alphaproteobacteria bacterium]